VERLVLQVFVTEVVLQCKIVLTAVHKLNAALVTENLNEVWGELQTMLIASANLSKMFWGSSGRREAERANLRDFLKVTDDSPIRDPTLRNDFEHFDERLESWYAASQTRAFIGRNIGSGNPVVIQGVEPDPVFQHFDPSTGTVTFWDHSVSVPEIANEAKRILETAYEESPKAGWRLA
jgi:hypothetical protein